MRMLDCADRWLLNLGITKCPPQQSGIQCSKYSSEQTLLLLNAGHPIESSQEIAASSRLPCLTAVLSKGYTNSMFTTSMFITSVFITSVPSTG